MQQFDNLLRDGLRAVTNTTLSDIQWLQATLPIKEGGLGIRKVSTLAISAFLASAAGTQSIQADLLSNCNVTVDIHYTRFVQLWESRHGSIPITLPVAKQSAWDRPSVEHDKATVLNHSSDAHHRARMSAILSDHSSDWLFALPITSCGLRLSNDAVRIAVGIRLGANICVPHTCSCGASVDCRGVHGLSCKLAPGRIPRHCAVNDLIAQALARAQIPNCKEPSGLSRTDGKRPDGVTLVPWSHGQALTWDVTVIDTLAESYLTNQTITSAAETAASRKILKYSNLPDFYQFQPVAIETLGRLNDSALDFLNELGRRLANVTGDKREKSYLFQRLSITIQRFNAVACLSSLNFSTAE